jgi:hypothetical protein
MIVRWAGSTILNCIDDRALGGLYNSFFQLAIARWAGSYNSF